MNWKLKCALKDTVNNLQKKTPLFGKACKKQNTA